jgi:hypothetical protein
MNKIRKAFHDGDRETVIKYIEIAKSMMPEVDVNGFYWALQLLHLTREEICDIIEMVVLRGVY